MTDENEAPPPNHPEWVPHNRPGHYCIAERWCPCGHFNRGRYATLRPDQRRGRVTIDVIEGNGDGSR